MKHCTIWVLGGLVLAGFVAPGTTIAGWVDEKAKIDVEASYLKHCSICHGDKGDAKTRALSGLFPKARDFTTAKSAIELTRERMIYSTVEGRPGTAMVAHKGRLPQAEIEALVDYIRAEFMHVPGAEASGLSGAVNLGEKIYTEYCSVCHGDKGNASYWAKSGLNPSPRDFTAPGVLSVLTYDRMINSVAHGRSGTGMTPFEKRLSKNEIAAVVKYIRFKFMGVDPDRDSGAAPLGMISRSIQKPTEQHQPRRGGVPGVNMPLSAARSPSASIDPRQRMPSYPGAQRQAAPAMPGAFQPQQQPQQQGRNMSADMSLPLPNGMRGSLEWGRGSYMQNCSVCHGVTGKGDGPRAYFINPRPRNFTSEASRQALNKPRIFDSINKGVLGTVMPAWSKVMTQREIASLTEFVFQAFIQPPGAMSKKKVRNWSTQR